MSHAIVSSIAKSLQLFSPVLALESDEIIPRGGLVDQHTKSDWHTKSDMTALHRARRRTRVFCNAKDTMCG